MSDTKTVEFLGQSFELNDSISQFDLYEFSAADIEDGRESMAAQFKLLKACIADKDWNRFRNLASKMRATDSDWLCVFTAMSEQVTDRPTGLPADSSVGQPVTELRSVPSSDDKGSGRFAGRPDIQAAIARTRAS